MPDRRYDTRSREEILAAPHFAPYLDATRLDEIGQRELRTLDRFFAHADDASITSPSVDDFLEFVQEESSARILENLRTAFDRLLPEGTPVLQTIREAIRAKRPRSRICDRRGREALLAEPHLAPFRDLPEMAAVALEDLRVLERFLGFASARAIEIPSAEDYLEFTRDTSSSRRLRSLKSALDTLLPGNPGVHIVLAEAIERKRARRDSRADGISRPPAERRVSHHELPERWRSVLDALKAGVTPGGTVPPADSVIDNMEDVLREYIHVQKAAGLPEDITVEGIRRLEASKTAHAGARKDPKYTDQGNRPATRHTVVMRVRLFAEFLGVDPLVLSALKAHENELRRTLGTVVPLKFGKLDNLPGLTEVWDLAQDLLKQSQITIRRSTRLRLLNEAVVIALWTLLPLRLRDGQLVWGRDIAFDGARYHIHIVTEKEREPLRGRLHPVLTPFLNALVLNGMDPTYLEQMRDRALQLELPLFVTTKGRQLARTYPSKVWRKHYGTGAHIARSRVHTALGQLGPEGVEMALALNAQRSARTAEAYQATEVERAMHASGQDMLDVILAECLG